MKAHKKLVNTPLSSVMLAGMITLGMTLGATPAMAGTSAALLKRLHEKGILSDEEYEQLVHEDEAENAPPTPAAAVETPASAPPAQVADSERFVRRTASGVGLEVGDVTLKFSGSVNGFYVHDNPQAPNATSSVAGGVVNVGGNTSAVRNGLLPASSRSRRPPSRAVGTWAPTSACIRASTAPPGARWAPTTVASRPALPPRASTSARPT
jgi:hypothetical protein